jgi:hypothetical protein
MICEKYSSPDQPPPRAGHRSGRFANRDGRRPYAVGKIVVMNLERSQQRALRAVEEEAVAGVLKQL